MFKLDFLKKTPVRLVLLLVSAVLTGITICYPALGIIEWITLMPAMLVLFSISDDRELRLRRVYLYGFFFFMCFFVTVWHWFFAMYPLEFTGMTAGAAFVVCTLAVLGIPLVQSSTFAFVFVLFAKMARGRVAERAPWIGPISIASLWTVFEWTQTLFWFGVPWGRLAIGQTELLFTLQSASLLGPYFVSFLIVLVNAAAAHAIYKTEARRLCACGAAALFAVNFAFGAIIMSMPSETQNTVKAAAIQGNVSSTEKWGAGWREITFGSYSKLVAEAAKAGAELVVWPESVVLNYDYLSKIELSRIAKENGVTMLVGALVNVGEDQYNVIIKVLPDGSIVEEGMYAKRHLVPFGEYVPMREFLTTLIPPLEDISMLKNDLVAGNDSNIAESEFGKIGSLICFDSIYEELARDSAGDGAELIVIGTNDSWFFDSAGVYMHEAQAKMRAIENGKYIVRAANTGVSAIISPNGEIIDEIAPLVPGQITADVEFLEGKTLYTYIGNLWVWLSFGFIVALLAADFTLKRIK